MGKNLKRIKILLNDKDRKPWSVIFIEVLKLTIGRKKFPFYYFGRFFYKKGFPNATHYMDSKLCDSILYSEKLNRNTPKSILNNKLYFSLFCQANSIETCNLLAYNLYNTFFYQNQITTIANAMQFYDFCCKLMEDKHPKRIFIKLCESMGGKGVYSITPSIPKNECDILWSNIEKDSFIFQEALEQHEDLSTIFPHSINTLRIETYLTRNGSIEILGGMIRFGCGESVIDNLSAGGLFVPINMDEGTLMEKGITNLLTGAHNYSCHPTTNFVFLNFKIPFFKETIDLCKKFAQIIPNKLIGWDVAITPNGPVIIEGNHNPGLLSTEFSYKGFKNKPIFKEILEDI
tara:strand:- start:14767 stop:15804 length:1038 start_codon:yes stop_codon:yes gene_type:complete